MYFFFKKKVRGGHRKPVVKNIYLKIYTSIAGASE